jgi:zinc transport system substrate-binding protein
MCRRWSLATALAVILMGGSAVILSGCKGNGSSDSWGSAGKPKVLVSFAPLYSFAKGVAGDDAEVKCLLTTMGPHTHGDASPKMIDLARGCDVFIVNGLGLDDGPDSFVPKLEKASANPKWNVLNLGAKFGEDWLKEGAHHHDHAKGEAEEDEHGKDPHVWLSVKHAKVMVGAIRDELKRLDAAHAAGYDQRAAEYLKTLDRLEADGKEMLAKKQEKVILSFHESLSYFAECYGLKIAGAIEVDPGKEPGGDKLAEIIKKCQARDVRVIAVEPQFNNHTSARVIRDALRGLKEKPIDAVFAEVDPLETCDERELSAELYEKTMRKNLDELSRALR